MVGLFLFEINRTLKNPMRCTQKVCVDKNANISDKCLFIYRQSK